MTSVEVKLIRGPDTRKICGECTVALLTLLNPISCCCWCCHCCCCSCNCCCLKSASKAYENIHFANNSIAMCKLRRGTREREGVRESGEEGRHCDPFASTAICSLATITAKYANKFVTMQQRTCLCPVSVPAPVWLPPTTCNMVQNRRQLTENSSTGCYQSCCPFW